VGYALVRVAVLQHERAEREFIGGDAELGDEDAREPW
jgi:hypothetical protein